MKKEVTMEELVSMLGERFSQPGKLLVLVTGVPGTGKSTLGKKIKDLYGVEYAEADMYFVRKWSTKYVFDYSKLCDAHDWCRKKTEENLKTSGKAVCTNTNLGLQWVDNYRKIAAKHKAGFIVVRLEREYGSIHDVPEKVMERARQQAVYTRGDADYVVTD